MGDVVEVLVDELRMGSVQLEDALRNVSATHVVGGLACSGFPSVNSSRWHQKMFRGGVLRSPKAGMGMRGAPIFSDMAADADALDEVLEEGRRLFGESVKGDEERCCDVEVDFVFVP